uniref:Immunoglobulin V-set domain-containing protein n=1 Tax=Sphaeramia orbicularis TaxID=375764 RepID=A0A672Z9G6_9TELE
LTDYLLFTVTISQLSAADAGKYWCGISKSFTDIYTEVKLNVKPVSASQFVFYVLGLSLSAHYIFFISKLFFFCFLFFLINY